MKEAFSTYGPLGGAVVVLTVALVWVLYHILNKAIPSMLTTFASEMKEERETCERRHKENKDNHKETQDCLKEVSGKVDDAMKENRHATRNVNHTLTLLINKIGQGRIEGDENTKLKGEKE